MANSVFAREQLLKHGWKDGSGLGKEESGIKEAIKVKIKHDTAGVGHDPGKEFTCHWWDHVFNKAASNITVETTRDGVQFRKSSAEEKQKAKTFSNKSVLYSGFVKAAVLQATETDLMTEVSCRDSDNEDDQSDTEANKAISKLTEEELFSQCEGRTAHKGARHGLKQNAKLLRIQQQEALLLESMKKRANRNDADESTNKNSCNNSSEEAMKTKPCDMQQLQELEENMPNPVGSEKTRIKKKKKSKNREKYIHVNESETNSSDNGDVKLQAECYGRLSNSMEINDDSCDLKDSTNKKSKKSKKKKRKTEIESENLDLHIPEKRKKSKKKKS